MTPFQLKFWLESRRLKNNWLNLPEIQEIARVKDEKAFEFLTSSNDSEALERGFIVFEGLYAQLSLEPA